MLEWRWSGSVVVWMGRNVFGDSLEVKSEIESLAYSLPIPIFVREYVRVRVGFRVG